MKLFCITIGFLCFYASAHAQQDTIAARIILIGDAGELTKGHHPVVAAVKQLIPFNAKKTVLYLRDNLYKTVLPDEQYSYYRSSRSVLDSHLSIADNTPAQISLTSGNS